MKRPYLIFLSLAAAVLSSLFAYFFPDLPGAPQTFEQAKIELRRHVYHDWNSDGDFYCGCQFEWTGVSGGRVDLASCGYQIRAQETRAQRIEWEHILPASAFGRLRQCWQDGGRSHCNDTDPVFNVMEADMHNLAPAVGEVNADRSNYRFDTLTQVGYQHGACDFKVDFNNNAVEPRDAIKGMIARTYFYMHDRYDLAMPRAQQQLMMTWHNQFPATAWERERDARIRAIMGHSNPFVTGERQWMLGHQNSADGVVSWLPERHPAAAPQPSTTTQSSQPSTSPAPLTNAVRGNQNSKVYHLPQGCPGYDQMSARNRVEFASERDAIAAGFRKAGNCR